MGILDDAIRQHLELKRQHGADGSDLDRLEKEAFGPATRPGDPEFVDAGAPATDAEGETTVAPLPEQAVPTTPAGEGAAATAAAQARAEHPGLGDSADQPGPRQLGSRDEAEAAPAEPRMTPEAVAPVEPPASEAPGTDEPPESPEHDIFDAEDFDDLELDLDLDLDEEVAAPPVPSGPVSPEAAGSHEAPEGGRPETPFETDPNLPPAPLEPPVEEGSAPRAGEEGEGGASDEDLLEETPDFLQDAPEGEDLWFEQGPPKDFDFDDD